MQRTTLSLLALVAVAQVRAHHGPVGAPRVLRHRRTGDTRGNPHRGVLAQSACPLRAPGRGRFGQRGVLGTGIRGAQPDGERRHHRGDVSRRRAGEGRWIRLPAPVRFPRIAQHAAAQRGRVCRRPGRTHLVGRASETGDRSRPRTPRRPARAGSGRHIRHLGHGPAAQRVDGRTGLQPRAQRGRARRQGRLPAHRPSDPGLRGQGDARAHAAGLHGIRRRGRPHRHAPFLVGRRPDHPPGPGRAPRRHAPQPTWATPSGGGREKTCSWSKPRV